MSSSAPSAGKPAASLRARCIRALAAVCLAAICYCAVWGGGAGVEPAAPSVAEPGQTAPVAHGLQAGAQPEVQAPLPREKVYLLRDRGTRRALGRFVSEIAALGREYARVEMTVVECDAKVHRTTHLTEGDLDAWERTSRRHGLRGGGGTDFNPIFDLLAQHTPQALVFFTDGCGDAPDHPPSVPVLWVMADEDDSPPVEWGARVWMTPGHESAPRG
jgi:hypothetical protein